MWNTCVKFQDLFLTNQTAWILWPFVRNNEYKIRHFLQITCLQSRIQFYRQIPLNVDTGRSDLRFFAGKILQTCLGVHLPLTGSCKIRRSFVFTASLGKKA